ncbi:precorrin-3B synthase [Tolypothrix sp. NIES-4075]|uniref:precorrin-3B synthase n=1 Tax=Tolypothrix sp. NIES-4075 TaxID=2005459 RepID=UPI000B5C6754|nr:precorrin-3B synthase [Tolypothrix sp. NIES-4075]GAX40491.1 precorrin-3B synthase [Tolypothrix sp. NIES-4075]
MSCPTELATLPVCPGLFYATPARDGIISRIRIPGGIINSQQGRAIAEFAEDFGEGYVHVTNRANLQIRKIQGITPEVLTTLQKVGLAATLTEVDHLRNIMASPTAGIDSLELIDTRPWVRELDAYICGHPELKGLSPKFSVAFDGGGAVRVCDRPNEIIFRAMSCDKPFGFGGSQSTGSGATAVDGSPGIKQVASKTATPSPLCVYALSEDCAAVEKNIYFQLILGDATNILLQPKECLSVVVAIAQVYLDNVDQTKKSKLRLKHLLQDKGVEWYLQQAQGYLPFSLLKRLKPTLDQSINPKNYNHLGVHPQRQAGLSYIGIILPLGQLLSKQLHSLTDLAQTYGSGTLRLTPWQNLLISDIPNSSIPQVKDEIECLGLDWNANHIQGSLVACTGKTGCTSSATDTKKQALALADYLKKHITLDVPVKIHFSGCPKSCAYHGKSDITLLGTLIEKDKTVVEGYHIYVGDKEQSFGRELYTNVCIPEVPHRILQMLEVYQIKRTEPDESFGEFTNRYTIPQLRQLFDESGQ